MQNDPASLHLYKAEWRKAQHLRLREGRLLPHVVKSAFPPAAGPHGLASHPPPSYATPPHAQQGPARAIGVQFGALDAPGSQAAVPVATAHSAGEGAGVARYYPGRAFDWSEKALNAKGTDYLMLRQHTAATAVPEAFGARRSLSRGRGAPLARVAMREPKRPATSAAALGAARVASPPGGTSLDDRVVTFGAFGERAARTACIADHNTFVTRARPAATGGDAVALGGSACGSSQRDDAARARLVADCSSHLHESARSLRSYHVSDVAHRPPTAISTIADTFARPPRAPHEADPMVASPSERIAANYSLSAWGVSPRTLRRLSRAGVRAPPPPPGGDGAGAGEATRTRAELMPLELFDDPEREARSGEAWVALGADEGGTLAYTPWLNLATGAPRRVLWRVRQCLAGS